MNRHSIARLEAAASISLGHAVARVALDPSTHRAWRAAANDSAAAVDDVAKAVGSVATAARSVSRAGSVTAATWREYGGRP